MRVVRQFWAVAAAFALCPVAAALASADPSGPLLRLGALVQLERSLGLYFEPALWRWFASEHALSGVAGALYVWGHLPATVGALVWARLERPRRFPLARDAFVVTQLVVVAGYLVAPTAPPRARLQGFDPWLDVVGGTVAAGAGLRRGGHGSDDVDVAREPMGRAAP